jgi:hypothetical protein
MEENLGLRTSRLDESVVSDVNSESSQLLPQKKIRAHKVIERISQRTLQILRLLAENAHLETKHIYEVEPSRSEWSEARRSRAE